MFVFAVFYVRTIKREVSLSLAWCTRLQQHPKPGLWSWSQKFRWWSRSLKFGFRCQAKFLTSAKFLTCYCLSVTFFLRVLLRVKE